MRSICSQAAGQIQAALHDLDPQMILFVDHQADLLLAVDGHAAGAFGSRRARG